MNYLARIVILLITSTSFLAAENDMALSLAVNDLSAQGVSQNEAVIVSEQLRTELMKFPNFRLVERSQMTQILKEQGFQQSGCTSDACAVEVGQLLGVTLIAVGSVGKAGSYTVLTVRIIDVSSGVVVVNKSMQTRGGVDKLLEGGIRSVAANMYYGFFPDTTQKMEVAKVKNKGTGKILAIGGGALALLGGGVAAYMYLQPKASSEEREPVTNNTRIELP